MSLRLHDALPFRRLPKKEPSTDLILKALICTQILQFSRKPLQNLAVHDFRPLLTPFDINLRGIDI